jgi:hypothetical protein
MTDDMRLDDLFQRYREACPDPEPGTDFMPALWTRIEARHSFWSVFGRLAKAVTAASAAVCLLLLLLNIVAAPDAHLVAPTYADALMADHSAERTYYAEAIRTADEPAAAETSH